MEQLQFTAEPASLFELTLILKNHKGEPLLESNGQIKKRNFKTNSAYKLFEFYQRNQNTSSRNKKSKNKTSNQSLPTGQEATNLQDKVAQYAEKQQSIRDNNNGVV